MKKTTATISILVTYFTFQYAYGLSFARPELPKPPSHSEILERNALAGANSDELLRYLEQNLIHLDISIVAIQHAEESKIISEYSELLHNSDKGASEFLRKSIEELQKRRLSDKRRIVDAVLRLLGEKGNASSISRIAGMSYSFDRNWVAWKLKATLQEILERVDPSECEYQELLLTDIRVVAPLLRDLDPQSASSWAWALWEFKNKHISHFFRGSGNIGIAIWLANEFASEHPKEAFEVYRAAFEFRDPAIHAFADMSIRSGVGGSIPIESRSDTILNAFSSDDWKSRRKVWDALPYPIEYPVTFRNYLKRRTDLVWFTVTGTISKRIDNFQIIPYEFLANGLLYSQLSTTKNYDTIGLIGNKGIPYSRFFDIYSPSIKVASHGGLWALKNNQRTAIELATDGSYLWECQLESSKGDFLLITPISRGKTLLVGYDHLACINRRGDLIWESTTDELDDPRFIIPVSESRYLVSCTNSVGWLSKTANIR